MQSLTYYTLDVFTHTQFGGNPLAVFTDAVNLPTHVMQQIAKELNLSETVFLGEKSSITNRWPVRIFTPDRELPFAGHPTIGTACLLRELSWLDMSSPLVLDEGVGPVPIEFEPIEHGGYIARFQCAVDPIVEASKYDQHQAAALLSLDEQTIADLPYIADCGIPFLMIPLTHPKDVENAVFNFNFWADHLKGERVEDVCIYAVCSDKSDVKMRMFAPASGIAEDPATGSAAAALSGALALREEQKTGQRKSHNRMIYQGTEIGRPSYIGTFVKPLESSGYRVEVFGQSLLVSQGTFYLQSTV